MQAHADNRQEEADMSDTVPPPVAVHSFVKSTRRSNRTGYWIQPAMVATKGRAGQGTSGARTKFQKPIGGSAASPAFRRDIIFSI